MPTPEEIQDDAEDGLVKVITNGKSVEITSSGQRVERESSKELRETIDWSERRTESATPGGGRARVRFSSGL